MVTVLFVCLGNICRSPMAEAIFRQKVQQAGLESTIQVFSAATSHWEVGSQPHKGTRKILEQQGISYQGMRATQIQPSDFKKYDYIIGMDANNVADLKALAPQEEQCGFIYLWKLWLVKKPWTYLILIILVILRKLTA